MRRWPRGLILSILLVLLPKAFSQGRIDCSALPSQILKRAVRFCVELPAGYETKDARGQGARYPVLYFLHGLGDDEQTMFKTGGWALIDELQASRKIVPFLVIAPEGRTSFYINSADGRERYSDFFVREFIPYVEKEYRVQPGKRGRAIAGISMGGYGALRFAFAYPEMFSSVSAQSAALILDSPKQLNAAAQSGSPVVQALSQVFGNPIDEAHWRANNPFELARRNQAALRHIAIYFNCGNRDDYGFEKGAASLDRQLTAEAIPHAYWPYPGDHSLTYFLTHLGETMEFHSRAFARTK